VCQWARRFWQRMLPGLAFLPAGRPDANPTELLASTRMRDVAALLGGHDATRLVLFDSAPLMLTTESHALAQVVGQILVVVRPIRPLSMWYSMPLRLLVKASRSRWCSTRA